MNINELNTFNLADAVKFHHRLNPRLWGSDEHLLPEVREKLLAIAADFQEFLGVDDLKVQDLTVSGSNAAYSYTPHSDIDLHLVVEMPDDPVYQELFNAKKYQYNDEHDIRIGGVPVELYVQPADQKHISQGIYSIMNNDWTQVPQRRRAKIDDSCVQHKAADLDARIHAAVKSGDADAINRLWDRIKDMRKTSLEQNGEFGCENIVFKLLRNRGCIGRLKDAKTALRDRELSLAPVKKPRKRVNYGMRDYWYPGTAYAGQDHPAGTESEQVDEAVGEAGGAKVYAIGDSHGEGLSYTKGIINYAHGGQPSTSSSNYSGEYQGHPTGIGNVPDGSFVVISQGCNDAANSSRANLDSKGKVPLVPPETIANNVVRLVNAALAKRCKVVVVLFPNGDPNTRPYYGGPYQEKVRQAIKASVGVPVVDLEGSPLRRDGVHAVSSAYEAAGSKVLSIFKTINEASSGPGPRIVVVGDSIAVGIAQAAGLPYEAVVGRNTRQILDAAASNPEVQGADLAIVSAGTNDYAILKGDGKNPNRKATIQNIGRIRDVLKAKQYVWILPFYETARDDVLSAIGNDTYVSLADVATTGDKLHPKNYKAVAQAALSKFAKPGIMESADIDHLKKILHRFYRSCVDKLKLKNPPRLHLETTPDWSRENGSFGQYKSENNTLILATAGRHVLDILRTMAHEMTHRQQDEREPLPIDAGETGSPWEDQANAMAGRIMRQWAEEQPEMFDGVTLEESIGNETAIVTRIDPHRIHDFSAKMNTYYHTDDWRQSGQFPAGEKIPAEFSGKVKGVFAGDPLFTALYATGSSAETRYVAKYGPGQPTVWFDKNDIPKLKNKQSYLTVFDAGNFEKKPSGEYFSSNPGRPIKQERITDPFAYIKKQGWKIQQTDDLPAVLKHLKAQDNARYGAEGMGFAEQTMAEASGYIPTRKQAKDPRFVMALTKDVRPGAVGREANKLGLQTDSQGHPALLTAGLQKLLREFKEQDLFEINMSPSNLRTMAAKTGALAGMEFEMYVPDPEDNGEQEQDWNQDQQASSPSDIRDFFYDGEYNSRRDVDRLIDRMMDDYSEWQSEEFGNRWESDSEQFIYDYIKDNVDDDEIRQLLDLEEEDPIGRNEYQLAADKIATDRLEPWYEDAENDARDDFYNEDLFEEWLDNEGLDTMSGISQNYDIQWPHWVSSGSEIDIKDVAESFSQAVGRPVRAFDMVKPDNQERPAPGKNFYILEPDGSLGQMDSPNDAGLEFVSPPLPIDDILSDLNKVKKWADQNGCYTNSSTGLHINISVPNYDLDRLDYVKLALLMGDEYVSEQFGRLGAYYAKSAMGKIRSRVGSGMNGARAKAVLDKMTSGLDDLAHKAIHSGETEKYTSINTKTGHVEFRSPGGDWLDKNFDKIENTLLRFTVALSAAMDPKAYREEYLKKLYKVLNVSNEGDPLAIFARYAAGQGLPADALKSFVRQAQADRKAKKSGEAIVNGHRWRVALKPELGGGVVEVTATDPIDAKKQAIRQQPNWRFVDDSALTIERLDEPAAGASTTGPHPQGRGRPNDPNGRLAIVNRDDPLVFAYGHGTPGPAPNYLFRFTLPDGYSQAQLRSVLAAWAARENANAADYMVVDTTQFLAPAAPESASVQWNIIDRNNNLVHTFWNRNVQRDANAAAHEWLMANDELPSVDMQGPFDVIPAAGSQVAFIPGSTLDLQRQRQAADAAANTRRWADYEASQAATPTPVPGVQDIEIEIPPAQTQWEVYDRSTDQPVFRMYAADQAEAWRKGREWVANYARMTPDQPIYGIDYSVRQSTAPVSEGRENDRISFQVQKGKNRFATAMKVNDQQVGVYQYNANTGRSVAEVYPEFKGKGLGKLLVLHAIYTAAQLGLDFQEDESRTSAYDNVLDSLSSNGYIVDDDGRWYVTGKGEQYLTQSVKQDVTEGRKPFRDLKSWSDHAKSQGLKVSEPSNHIDWTHDATDKQGNVRGRFVRTRVPQNSRGFIHQQDVNENRLIGSLVRNTMNFGRNIGTKAKPAVTVFTNPANQGAMIRQAAQAYPVKELPLSKLRLNEPDSKMANPANRMTVMSMVDTIKKGGELPPIIVVPKNFNYTILDGHHRYAAYKLAGVENVPVKILDPKDVKYTDIVDPDLARTTNESREITKLHKLDSVLEKCIEMIRRGHETDPDKYGRVAACVIDNKNNHTYAINMPGPDGTRRHAERMAIDKHLKRHGRIGPNAIMVTTLSPCVNHMDERYGESCTDLLADYGIEKCYAGWQDPTQHPAEDYPFNLQVTDNADIFNTCRDIAASFLPQTVAEGVNDYLWHGSRNKHDVLYPHQAVDTGGKEESNKNAVYATPNAKFAIAMGLTTPGSDNAMFPNDPQMVLFKGGIRKGEMVYLHKVPKDLFIKHHGREWYSKPEVKEVKPIEVIAVPVDKWLHLIRQATPKDFELRKKYMKKNVDEAYTGPPMKFLKPGELSGGYSPQQMQAMGFKQTANGTWYIPMNTWQRLVSGGQIKENFADGRHPEDKGDSKRHGINTKASVSSLRKTAKQGGRKGQLAHWLANMKAGRAKAKRKTNEAVDAQTVANFNTRVQFALAKIAQNTDPRYPDQKEFVQLIAANKVKIMNGNPSNPAFSSGHDLNMDAEEFHDAPIEVLILVMAHEIGHIIYGHTFQDPKNPNPTVSQEQQEEYDADQFAINIMKRIGITKIPVWTWLRRKKNDLEQFKRDQDAAPPGSWPTYNQRSDQARKMGVELTKANTDQIDQALQHMG